MDFRLIILLEFALFVIIFAIVKPRNFILLYFLIKPAVDWFALKGTDVIGMHIRSTFVGGIIVPILAIFYVLVNKKDTSFFPVKGLLVGFVALNIYNCIISGDNMTISFMLLVRIVLPLLMYVSIPHILKTRSDILILIKMIALSGIFPMIVGFLQLAGIIPYTRIPGVFGAYAFDRITGGYCDSFSFSLPIIFAILSILFLFQYNKKGGTTKRVQKLYGVLLISYISIMIYTYHRLAYITLIVTIFLWSIYNKRRKLVLLLAAFTILSLPFTSNFLMEFYSDVYKPFLSSPDYSSMPVKHAFHGRWGIWEEQLSHFSNYSFSEKLLGKTIVASYVHNDFIRILVSNGIIGLTLYVYILGFIGKRINKMRNIYKEKKDEFMHQLSIICQLIFITYVLASITLAITMISTPQWFLWSFCGILFYQHRKVVIGQSNSSTL